MREVEKANLLWNYCERIRGDGEDQRVGGIQGLE